MKYLQEVNLINEFVRQNVFFEFSIYAYSGRKLILGGSPDLLYYHNLEIHFSEPFFISGKTSWVADTDKVAIEHPSEEELMDYNLKNWIEVGYHTLKFIDQDGCGFYYTFEHMEVFQKVVKYYTE